MSDAAIVESNNQFVSLGRFVASDKPGAELYDGDGIAMCWAGSPLIFFNTFFLTEHVADPAELKRHLHAAAEFMRAKPQAGMFFICDDYLADQVRPQLDAAIVDAGLAPAMETIGMVGDFLSFDRSVKYSDLHFRRVTDEETLRSFADVNSDAYGLPLELMRGGLEGSALWKEHAFCYVGYHDGKAVSTAAVMESEGHLYVAFVATRPEAHRRGFAAATMRRALEAAHEATGLHRTSLHATQVAIPVYERMGYRRVTRVAGYTLGSAEESGK
jgi:GNAT superfamily N-acetyltransferase